jgi:uncharacterized protein YbjT (DUF2867 family)
MRVAVAGGTGVVGRHIVEACRQAGYEVNALSRRTGVDLTAGDGLRSALEGVEVIVDASNSRSQSQAKATAFFTTATANLQRAGHAAGVQRLLTISIVSIDRFSGMGYYQAKLDQEAAALAGPLPATILRATQFHEFPLQVMGRLRLGKLALVPRFRVQTVAARAVGETAAELIANPPAGTRIDVAGPEVRELVDLARAAATRLGRGTRVIGVPLPGRLGKAARSGALTASGEARIVGPTFKEWLAGDDVFAVGA